MDFSRTGPGEAPDAFGNPAVPCAGAAALGIAPPRPCKECPVRGMCLASGSADSASGGLCAIMIGHRRVPKGRSLFREEDRFLFMYAIRFGSFKSTISLRDGGEQVAGFHLAGDVMGFDGTATGVHPTTATALEDAEVCAIPYAQLAEASLELRSLQQQVMRMVGVQLVRDQRLLTLVANAPAEERVAAFLLHLSHRMHEIGYSSSDLRVPMTRADIGSYLGTTLETVSRCISAFVRKGYVTVSNRRIHLVGITALREAFQTRLP